MALLPPLTLAGYSHSYSHSLSMDFDVYYIAILQSDSDQFCAAVLWFSEEVLGIWMHSTCQFVLKRTPQLPWNVQRCTLASKAPLSGQHGICALWRCPSNAHTL